RVGRCHVLLCLIGDDWLTTAGPTGGRRLDDAHDFVRIEVEAALHRGIPVIPVLVGTAPVPRAEDLPPELNELAFRNGMAVPPNPTPIEANGTPPPAPTSTPRIDPAAAAAPQPERRQPPILDSTTGGVDGAAVRKCQRDWAAYLGRQVEEQDEIAPGVTMAFV